MDEAKFERMIEELWKLFKETDRKINRISEDLENRFKDTDAEIKELAQSFKDTDRNLTRLERLFTGQWGKLMETIFEGGITKLFKKSEIEVSKDFSKAQ